MFFESRVSHEKIDHKLAEVDPSVPIRLCASASQMAASGSRWPGVRMLYRLRIPCSVQQMKIVTRQEQLQDLSQTVDEHRSVRKSAVLSFSRTRSGVVIDASLAFLQGPHSR
jgi:hypothetical protein